MSLCILTFFANPVISAEEDEEEYTELEYYYNDNKTKVKIPAKYETKDAEIVMGLLQKIEDNRSFIE